MKQVQTQQLTNITWCFPTPQINQPGTSQAQKKERREREGEGVEREKGEGDQLLLLGDSPVVFGVGGCHCLKRQVHSCKPGSGSLGLMWWGEVTQHCFQKVWEERAKTGEVTSSHNSHVWAEDSGLNRGASAINSQEASGSQSWGKSNQLFKLQSNNTLI